MASNGKGNVKEMPVPGYGKPEGSDYPSIHKIDDNLMDESARYSREDLNVCETINNGYMFYVIGNAIFAKDISGYFYKLNKTTKEFEWFSDGWLEDNEFSIGVTPPCPPTYISFNKDGYPVFPTTDDKPGKPILPRNEKGDKVFPYDPKTSEPLFPLDFHGEPCFPIDDSGKPVFPQRPDGRPLVPLDSQGVAVFPRDADGKVMFPERADGRPIPPCTIYGNAIVPFKENGEPDLPVDSQGNPLILLGGDDGMTPMTEEEYQQWQCAAAMYGQALSENYYAEMAQNEQVLEAYRSSYYNQYYPPAQDPNGQPSPAANPPPVAEKSEADIEKEKKRKLLAMQMKSMIKSKALTVETQQNAVISTNEDKSSSAPATIVPANRPPLPNKEKERGERYIPERLQRRRREDNDEQRFEDRRVSYGTPTKRDENDRGWRGRGGYRGGRGYAHTERSHYRRRSRSRSASNSPYRLRQERQSSASSRSRSRSRSKSRGRKRTRKSSSSRSRSRSATYSDDERNNKRRRDQNRSSSQNNSSDDDSRKRHHKSHKNKSEKNKKRNRQPSSSSEPESMKENATEESVKEKEVVRESCSREEVVPENDDPAVDEVIQCFQDNEEKDNRAIESETESETERIIRDLRLKLHYKESEITYLARSNSELSAENQQLRVERAIEKTDFETQKRRLEDARNEMLAKTKEAEGSIQREVERKKLIDSLQKERILTHGKIKKLETEIEEFQKTIKLNDEEFAKYKRETGFMLIAENERISRICRQERDSIMRNTMVEVEAKYGPILAELKNKSQSIVFRSAPRKNIIRRGTKKQVFIRKQQNLDEVLQKATEAMDKASLERSMAEKARNDCEEILRLVERSYNLRSILKLPEEEGDASTTSQPSKTGKEVR